MSPHLHALFDPTTSTLTYVLWDPLDLSAVILDPVLDYDPSTQLTSTTQLDKLHRFLMQKQLRPQWVIETHVHADHLSGARELKRRWPGLQWAMSAAMDEVFATFKKVFAWKSELQLADLGVDRWLQDGEEFSAGRLRLQAIAVPGHTPACTAFVSSGHIFSGDALMMPDAGTGRCDFPGGSAGRLYDSILSRIYSRPEADRVYVGHDYQPGGRPLRYHTTVGDEKWHNIHLRQTTSRADFIAFREGRDKTLSPPRLLEPSLDWNLGAHQIVKPLKLT